MRRATGGSLVGMEPLLSLQTSIGEAFEVNWATCQQLANEGSQPDPTQIETPLNWPPERAGTAWQFGGRNAASANPESVMEAGGEGEGG